MIPVNYRSVLLASSTEHRTAEQPVAMDWLQHKNKLALARWRERQMTAALGPKRR